MKNKVDRYRISNSVNNKVITVSQGQRGSHPNDLIVQSYVGSPYQQFTIEVIKDKQVKIVSYANPTKTFDVSGQSKEIYKNIICYEYHGNPNQRWIIEKINEKQVQIISAFNNLVLQLQGGIDAEGMLVVQNTNYRNRSQRWSLQIV